MKGLRRFQDVVAICLLFALALLFFWKIALTNLILVGLDVFTYFYPYKAYAAETVRQGSLPLWNPYLFMGVPFLANIQAATLYPLSLPLYWLTAPKMISYSIVIHVFLGGAFTYFLGRRALALGPWGAIVSTVTLALGGFLGAQVEHVNQLSVLIWLPLLLWLLYLSHTRKRLPYLLLASLVIAVQFLGGHVQASYVSLVALGCYALYLSLEERLSVTGSNWRFSDTTRRVVRGVGLFLAIVLLGGGLAAFQLVPSYELSTVSIRSGGLSYREAVSFSLRPGMAALSLLPSYGDTPFSEYVAFVGIIPMILAFLGIWRRRRKHQTLFFLALALLGLVLALGAYNPLYYVLYRLVPGFGLFRAPARWLYLYTLGMAILAGQGVDELASLTVVKEEGLSFLASRRRIALVSLSILLLVVFLLVADLPSWTVILTWLVSIVVGGTVVWLGLRRQRGVRYLILLASLVVAELFVASRYLAYNDATAPQAFSSMRSAVAHVLTGEGVFRFLSFSDGAFDPGDLHDIQRIFAGQLSDEAVYDYLVATKEKEILSPNLSLQYRLQGIDGYDGGVLPLARYVQLQRLLLPEEEISPDGRLQGRIAEIPRGRVLNLFNVKYIITDKVYDVWVDGVYYDLGQRATLGRESPTELGLDDLPAFPTTALGVVSYLIDGGELEQGSAVAEITIDDGAGQSHSFLLRAGEDTAEGEYDAATQRHRPLQAVGHWRGNPAGNDYHTLFDWQEAVYPQEIRVRYLADEGQIRLRGMTLIDQRTGTHQSLIVSTEGRYRLAHSGDVKIYENLDVLPRAFVVHEARVIEDDEAAIAAMQEESFVPRREVILSTEGPTVTSESEHIDDQVSILSYEPERVTVEAHIDSPGYLVLTDAFYPGWRAQVDGQSVEILRADYYFRAIYLPQGDHAIEFAYDPTSFRIGLAVSLVSVLAVAGALGWERLRKQLSAC